MPELAKELGAKMQLEAVKSNAAAVPSKPKAAAVQSKKVDQKRKKLKKN
jgi:hypothetical protein